MGKKPEPQRNLCPLPRRFVSAEALLTVFPELGSKLGAVPSKLQNGTLVYDVLAAADIVNANRPPLPDDREEGGTLFSDNGDTH